MSGGPAKFLRMSLAAIALAGCAFGSKPPPASQDVTIAPIQPGTDEAAAAAPTGMKRAQLEAEIMRFADRYAGRMATEMFLIQRKPVGRDVRWFAVEWNRHCRTAVVSIAVGPNAVENLLDMLVLTSLARRTVESYVIPEILGEELGKGLLEASRALEKDAWEGAEKVLTAEQAAALRSLIAGWIEQNPGELNFWEVRFRGFAGQRAAQLSQVTYTGGLLGEVEQTRQTAERFRQLSERVLYYMQRAPAITRLEAQFAVYDFMRQPEVADLFESSARLTTVADRLAAVAESLPGQQFAVVNQLMGEVEEQRIGAIDQITDRVKAERVAAITQLSDELTRQRQDMIEDVLAEEPRVRSILADLRTTIEAGQALAGSINDTATTIDTITARIEAGRRKPAKPFNIDDYKQLVSETSVTVREMKELVSSTDRLLLSPGWKQRMPMAQAIIEQVDREMERLIYQIFAVQAGFIVLLFALLLGYRYALSRLNIPRK
jgi:hypothetical protein